MIKVFKIVFSSLSCQSNVDEYQPNENEEKNPYPSTETPGNSLLVPTPTILFFNQHKTQKFKCLKVQS